MSEDETDHSEGVNLGDVDEILDEISYPISGEEFVEQYGNHEIERTNTGPITIQELFEPMNETTMESKEGAEQTIMGLMPKESVGRQRYSDRGATVDDAGDYGDRQDRQGDEYEPQDEQEQS